jgi:CHAT domain-containing protein/tetratricopeptide (TPR) repeat protein
LGVILNRFARHLVLRKGNYEGAMAAYQTARRLHEALQAPINAAQNTADLAVVAQSAGDRTAALTYYEEALDRYLKVIEHYPEQFPGGNDIVSNIRQRILMLATNAYQLSLQKLDSDGMERYAARLRDQVRELPDFQGDPADLLSMLSRQMGGLLSGKGSEAAMEIEAGVEFWSLRQMAQSAIEQAAVLAPLYRSRRLKKDGQIEDAAQQWKQAHSALETISPGTRDMFEAVVWSEIKENEKAADAYRRFLEQGGADAGFTGILTQLMEQVGGSHGQAERGLQDRRTHQNAFTMWVRLDNFEEARQHLEALENLDGPEWWRQESQPWQYLSDCAEMYDGLGNPEKALEYFDKAIEMLEARRALLSRDELKTALAADKGAMYLYFLAARTAVKVKQYALAFSFTEKAKARALLDLVAGSLSMAGASDLESSAMRRWRQLNAELSLQRGLMAQERSKSRPDEIRVEELSAKIENGESALHELEEELLESNPDFFNAVNAEAPTLTLESVAELLPDDACLIEYFFQGEEMLIWAVDHKGLKQVWPSKVDEGELERTVKALHQACEQRRPLAESAGRLAEMLLGPMLEYLRDYRRLYIVPHGALHTLPFHVLPFEGLPLAGRFEIAYLPSAGALQFLKPAAISGKDEVLVIGNPTLDLQSAYAEAAYVAALFGQEPLLGDAATEQAVVERIGRARLVHFATHGRLSEEAPLLSSIALASDEELSLYELMGLQLSADLVVLSACNTARGETTGGDDVLGLTRGLFAAGAKAAIVTLWEVNDLSTSLFMGEFYRRLKAGGSPAWSLRQAQDFLRNLQPEEIQRELEKLEQGLAAGAARDAVKRGRATRDLAGDEAFAYEEPVDYSHPFYWAPFVLVGRL